MHGLAGHIVDFRGGGNACSPILFDVWYSCAKLSCQFDIGNQFLSRDFDGCNPFGGSLGNAAVLLVKSDMHPPVGVYGSGAEISSRSIAGWRLQKIVARRP